MGEDATPRGRDRSLLMVVAVGALVRLVYLATKWGDPLLLNDSIYYSGQARQLAEGTWFRELFVDRPGAEHGPLTSTLMAPLSWMDDPVPWQRTVTVLTGVALVWVLGHVAGELAGRRVGLTAAGTSSSSRATRTISTASGALIVRAFSQSTALPSRMHRAALSSTVPVTNGAS